MVSSWQQNNCADFNIYDFSVVLDQGNLCGFEYI
jgi:hypothetical protein